MVLYCNMFEKKCIFPLNDSLIFFTKPLALPKVSLWGEYKGALVFVSKKHICIYGHEPQQSSTLSPPG